MATKGKRSDEGGSGAETKGRVPQGAEETHEFDGPYGDTEIDRDLEELEHAGLAAGGRHDAEHALGHTGAGRREEIASNPDNEEQLAEEALQGSAEESEDEATHDRKRRG
jgi:hypothetical protein